MAKKKKIVECKPHENKGDMILKKITATEMRIQNIENILVQIGQIMDAVIFLLNEKELVTHEDFEKLREDIKAKQDKQAEQTKKNKDSENPKEGGASKVGSDEGGTIEEIEEPTKPK